MKQLHWLILIVIGAFIGAAVHGFTTDTLFATNDAKAVVEPTTPAPTEVQHHTSSLSRFSVETIHVNGRPTWVLYDKEMGTQFIADAKYPSDTMVWTAVNPPGG